LPAIANGRVFVQDGTRVTAVDAATGQLVWSSVIDASSPVYEAEGFTVNGGAAVIGGLSVVAFALGDGSALWKFKPDSSVAAAIPAADGQTYYTGQRSIPILYALDLVTGTPRWRTNIGNGWQYQAFVVGVSYSGDTLYVNVERFLNQNGGVRSAVVVGLDKRDGHELWRYETPTSSHGSRDAPIVFENLLIIDDFSGGGVFAIDRFSPSSGEKWRMSAPGNSAGPTTPSFIYNGTIFTGFGGGYFYAIDARTGTVKWSHQTFQWVTGVTACKGSAFANVANIERYDAETGSITGHSASGKAPLTSGLVTDGARVYVVGDDGVHAFAC